VSREEEIDSKWLDLTAKKEGCIAVFILFSLSPAQIVSVPVTVAVTAPHLGFNGQHSVPPP
jgi:hypothetical protein